MKRDGRPVWLKRHAWDAAGYCPCGWRKVVIGSPGALTILFFDVAGVAGPLPRVCERPPKRRGRPVQLSLFKA
ncbi:MAG: hypothetical protein KGK07_13680 [Chloroflexota bacterium]|nr:hypothetical protein [Chloroflexota bacterium]